MLTTGLLRIYREIASRSTSTAGQCHPNRVHIRTRNSIRCRCRPLQSLLRWRRRVKHPNIQSPSPLSRRPASTDADAAHSRARVHGHVGAPLGMSPICLRVCRLMGCDRQRGCMRTKMTMAFVGMNSPEARTGIHHLYHYRRLTRRRGRSGSRVG